MSLLDRAVSAIEKSMTDKFEVNPDQPTMLQVDERVVHCRTLQEAVIAFGRLPRAEKERATLVVIDGTRKFFRQDEIDDLYRTAMHA